MGNILKLTYNRALVTGQEIEYNCFVLTYLVRAVPMIQQERIRALNREPVRNRKYVLYWMQSSQRAEYNHALEYAVEQANKRRKPVMVCFGITDNYPEANERHYYFMLEGLAQVQKTWKPRAYKW